MHMDHDDGAAQTAAKLVELYGQSFGGKASGRYRISMKHLRLLAGRRRLYPEDIERLEREVYELGFILIDLETFFVVVNQRTFSNHRRVNEDALSQ